MLMKKHKSQSLPWVANLLLQPTELIHNQKYRIWNGCYNNHAVSLLQCLPNLWKTSCGGEIKRLATVSVSALLIQVPSPDKNCFDINSVSCSRHHHHHHYKKVTFVCVQTLRLSGLNITEIALPGP